MDFLPITTTFNLINEPKINIKLFFGSQPKQLTKSAQDFLNRLAYVLNSHGIKPSTLLRLVPKDWNWTMRHVETPDGILDGWQPRQTDWLCHQFNIEPKWFETGEGRMQPFLSGYKTPGDVLQTLSEMGWLNPGLRMTLLAEEYQSGERGLDRYHIVFSQQIAEIYGGEQRVYAHQLFEGGWIYAHPPCLWDTKALARWFYLHHGGHAIPIVPITREEYDKLDKSECLVHCFDPDAIGRHDRFEDHVMSVNENRVAKKTSDLANVKAHMKEHLAPWLSATSPNHRKRDGDV